MQFSISLRQLIFYAFVLTVFVVLFSLGNWQLNRGRLKQSVIQHWEQADNAQTISPDLHNIGTLPDYQKVKLTGSFDNQHHLLLDNRTHNGQVGVEVFTPFVTDSDIYILVSRGFTRWGPSRDSLPKVESVSGHVIITGFLNPISTNAIVFKADDYQTAQWPMLVQALDTEQLGRITGRTVAPRMVVLDKDSEYAYISVREPKAYMTPEKHWGYAFQWYMLSITWVVLIYFFRRNTRQSTNDSSFDTP